MNLNNFLKFFRNFKQTLVHCYCFLLQVVLWDKIIERGQNAKISIKNEPLKYYFWDDGNGLL